MGESSRKPSGTAVGSGSELAGRIEALLSTLNDREPADVDAALQELTASALAALAPAGDAGITVATRGGRVYTPAATSAVPALLDQIQQRHLQGPCLSAAWEHHLVRIDDIEEEQRWPLYCREASSQTSIRSILSFRLFSDTRTTGALNFYSEQRNAFDEDSLELGLMIATHTALAWNLLRRENQFRSALASRDMIGQAKGLIMEKFGVDSVRAFELLKTLSQESNTQLSEIAGGLVEMHNAAVLDGAAGKARDADLTSKEKVDDEPTGW